MATETTAAATLPTADQLLLADYKIGSFKSDLELIRQEVERAAGKTISVAEALARVEAEAAPE